MHTKQDIYPGEFEAIGVDIGGCHLIGYYDLIIKMDNKAYYLIPQGPYRGFSLDSLKELKENKEIFLFESAINVTADNLAIVAKNDFINEVKTYNSSEYLNSVLKQGLKYENQTDEISIFVGEKTKLDNLRTSWSNILNKSLRDIIIQWPESRMEDVIKMAQEGMSCANNELNKGLYYDFALYLGAVLWHELKTVQLCNLYKFRISRYFTKISEEDFINDVTIRQRAISDACRDTSTLIRARGTTDADIANNSAEIEKSQEIADNVVYLFGT